MDEFNGKGGGLPPQTDNNITETAEQLLAHCQQIRVHFDNLKRWITKDLALEGNMDVETYLIQIGAIVDRIEHRARCFLATGQVIAAYPHRSEEERQEKIVGALVDARTQFTSDMRQFRVALYRLVQFVEKEATQ